MCLSECWVLFWLPDVGRFCSVHTMFACHHLRSAVHLRLCDRKWCTDTHSACLFAQKKKKKLLLPLLVLQHTFLNYSQPLWGNFSKTDFWIIGLLIDGYLKKHICWGKLTNQSTNIRHIQSVSMATFFCAEACSTFFSFVFLLCVSKLKDCH